MPKGKFRLRLSNRALNTPSAPPVPTPPLVNTTAITKTLTKGQPFSVPLTQTGAVDQAFWFISDTTKFSENDTVLSWGAGGEPAAGVHTVDITVTDTLQRSSTVTLTVTLNAAPAQINSAVQNLAIASLNDTEAIVSFNAPASGDPPLYYLYQVDGGNIAPLPTSKRIAALSPNTGYSVNIWPVNAAGTGAVATITFTTAVASTKDVPGEAVQFRAFDETNNSTYAFPNQAVNVGEAGQEYEIIVQSQAGASHIHKTVTLGGASATQILTTPASTHVVSFWRIAWGVGKTTPAQPVVTIRDAADANPLTALRCAVWLRPLKNRPGALVTSGNLTSNPASQGFTNIPANALVSILSGSLLANVDLTVDITNAKPDPIGEFFDTAMQGRVAHHSPADDEPSRTITALWKDPAGVGVPVNSRFAYVVYGEATPQVAGPVTPLWSDDLVEATGVATHFDWDRTDGDTGPWHYGNIPNLSAAIGELGMRYWRSKSYNVTAGANQMRQYTDAVYDGFGMRGFGPIASEADIATVAADVTSVKTRISNTIAQLNHGGTRRWIAFEGLNESNLGRTAGWNTNTQLWQKIMYNHVQSIDTAVGNIAPSIWGRNDIDRQTLAATAEGIDPFCTVGCIHLYNGGRNTDLCGVPLANQGDETGSGEMYVWEALRDAKALTPLKAKMYGTEMGFQLGNPPGHKGWVQPSTWNMAYGNNNLSEYAFMVYNLRFFVENLARGKLYGLNMYVHYNALDDITTRPNKCFGLMYPNQAMNDVIKRPAFYAWKRFLALLADRGSWSGTAWQFTTPPTLTPIDPRITGGDAATFPIVDNQTARGIWCKKRDGSIIGLLYQNSPVWPRNISFIQPNNGANYDPTLVKTPNDLTPARRTIVVKPNNAQVFSKIEVFEPTFDNTGTYGNDGAYGTAGAATARLTVNATNQVSVQLPAHVTVVKATP